MTAPVRRPEPPTAGIPPGMVAAVVSVLRTAPAPVRRRKLLEELERRDHRISLAGLNRTLQYCAEAGLTVEDEGGVRLRGPPTAER